MAFKDPLEAPVTTAQQTRSMRAPPVIIADELEADGCRTVKQLRPGSPNASGPLSSDANFGAPLRTLSSLVFDAKIYDAGASSPRLALCYLTCVRLFLLCSYRYIRVSVRAEVARRRAAGYEVDAHELEDFLRLIDSLSRTHLLTIERLIRARAPHRLPEEAPYEWASGRSVGLAGDCLRELVAQVVETFVARRTFRPDLARVAVMLAMLPAGVSPKTQQRVVQHRHPLAVFVENTVS